MDEIELNDEEQAAADAAWAQLAEDGELPVFPMANDATTESTTETANDRLNRVLEAWRDYP